ncbi:MAG: DUF6388 family protein [Pseudomonas sp.]|uniref:DUF6388 family protein n=1 Tax=Pseudomonas sp. TaxID=306 RepID=UPI002732F2ED|nr:DUF6388 family protein [Pseudomonas sp.]MDP3847564.1 DUF6388 family protein [Pseudomonas sp.]
MSIEKRYSAARDKYFAQNPAAVREINAVRRGVIEASGSTVEEYHEQRRIMVFADAAKAHGLETDEFVIRLMAESPEQAQEWRLERHRQIANAVGMEWSEYKQLNRIAE